MFSFKKDIYKSSKGCPNCIAHDVPIGTQIWTGCNANTKFYNNGNSIPEVTDPTIWASLTTGAWCHYDNDPANEAIYGLLYNWHAVNDPRGIAPTGYHVPTYTELTTLSTFLGGDLISGGVLKEAGTCHWVGNPGATNTSGFTGLPGGYRKFDDGSYTLLGLYGLYWSSDTYSISSAFLMSLGASSNATTFTVNQKNDGKSVRFIKD